MVRDYNDRFLTVDIKLFCSTKVLISLLLFAASILTLTFHWANRVNLKISEDRALEGTYRSACVRLSVECDSLHWYLWSVSFWMPRGTHPVSKAWNQMTYHKAYSICDICWGNMKHTHTWLLTNTDFSLYFVSGSSGALEHWSISP